MNEIDSNTIINAFNKLNKLFHDNKFLSRIERSTANELISKYSNILCIEFGGVMATWREKLHCFCYLCNKYANSESEYVNNVISDFIISGENNSGDNIIVMYKKLIDIINKLVDLLKIFNNIKLKDDHKKNSWIYSLFFTKFKILDFPEIY